MYLFSVYQNDMGCGISTSDVVVVIKPQPRKHLVHYRTTDAVAIDAVDGVADTADTVALAAARMDFAKDHSIVPAPIHRWTGNRYSVMLPGVAGSTVRLRSKHVLCESVRHWRLIVSTDDLTHGIRRLSMGLVTTCGKSILITHSINVQNEFTADCSTDLNNDEYNCNIMQPYRPVLPPGLVREEWIPLLKVPRPTAFKPEPGLLAKCHWHVEIVMGPKPCTLFIVSK